MASWIIYGSNNVAKATVKELELHDEWMAECYLTISVKSATPISFAVGDYIDYRGERYTIQYDPNVLKKATSGSYGEGFTYDNIKFVGLQDEVVRCDFNDIVLNDNDIHYSALPTFPFYCESVDDLLDRIQANLEDLYPGQWIIIGLNTVRNAQRGTAVGRAQAFLNAYKQYIDPTGAANTDPYGKQGVAETADNITCWDAMKKVHDDFDLNFIVRGRVIVVGTAGVFTANTFQYGKGNGLYEIERIGESDQRIVTRLRAYGSEQNLPAHYYNTINKQVYATITSILHKFDGNIGADFLLDLDFDRKYFTYRSESYPGTTEAPNYIIEMMANDVTVRGYVTKDATTGKCYVYCESVAGDDDRDEPDATKMAAFVQALTANDRLDFVEYVNKDAFGTGHYDYGTGHLPDNMAVSRLMLPGFPTMSLHAWVQAHKDDADKAWLAQAVADGFTFSTETYRPYIDSPNKTQYGVRPGSIYFDGSDDTEDVHPTIEGMTYNGAPIDEVYAADQVEDNGVYPAGEEVKNIKITLPVLGFELDKVYEEGASIDMKNGMCGARSFKMAGTPKKDANNRWVCTVERVHDDALDLWFPYCDFQIHGSSEAGRQHGDNYVLTGIDMPDAYIAAASVKLLQVSIEALKKNHAPRYTYQPRIDELWMQRQHDTATASQGVASLHDTLKAGDVFAFADTDLNIDANIIIDVLTIRENGNNGIPTYEVTLRDEKQVGTIQKITNKVDSIVSGAVSINGATGGGLTARQIQSLIDRYGGEQFLSKLNDDTAQGYIKMLKGLQVCNEFAAGPLGYGGVLRKREADGKVELEVDILYARMKAYFDTVEIREYQHTGGNRIASVAGNKICRVAWFNSSNVELEQTQANLASVAYFRCYFRAEDDETEVKNNWVVGDLAYCHVTSITNSSDNPEQKGLNQKHLWRLVIGRNTEGNLTADGEAYIDLSNRATETISGTNYTGYQSGSDAPAAQDDIIQLGNVNDTTRQGAIVEFVTGTDAPSYQIFQNINSFSLSGKNQIGFGYNTSTGRAYLNVFGDFRFGARPNTSGSYLEYNSSTGALNIKAHVEFTNSDQELDSLVQSHQRDDSYDDTQVRALISGLQDQIDGQVESWFYDYPPVHVDAQGAPDSKVPLNVAPYSDWTTDALKIAHLGDTFTDNSSGYCWRFTRNETTQAFEWTIIEDSAVITALQNAARAQDTADHKRRVFLVQPTPPYDAGDMWVNATYPATGTKTFDNDIVKCITSKAATDSFDIADWTKASDYTNDDKVNSFISELLNGSSDSELAMTAAFKAIRAAMNDGVTDIYGGLILTNEIEMRDTAATPSVWSGISGMYDSTALGNGVAIWAGGARGDWEAYLASLTPAQRESAVITSAFAKSLLRFDGSGYLAGGNITWNANGVVSIKDVTTIISSNDTDVLNALVTFNNAFHFNLAQDQTTVLSIAPQAAFTDLYIANTTTPSSPYHVATEKWVNDNYLSKTWFDQILKLHYKENASASDAVLEPNDMLPTGAVDITLESVFSFWTNYGLTALGRGVSGSQVVSVLDDLNDVTITNPQTNQVLKYNGTKWVNDTAPSGASALSGLTDVGISSLADKDILQYDYTNNVWKNVTLATALSGYATQSWVQQQGYALASALNNYVPTNNVQGYAIPEPTNYANNAIETTSFRVYNSSSETGIGFKRNSSRPSFYIGTYNDYGYICSYFGGDPIYYRFTDSLFKSPNPIEATSFVKTNGTSGQFLKADGSIDSNTYALASAIPTIYPWALASTKPSYNLDEISDGTNRKWSLLMRDPWNAVTIDDNMTFRTFNDSSEVGIGLRKKDNSVMVFLGRYNNYAYITPSDSDISYFKFYSNGQFVADGNITAAGFVKNNSSSAYVLTGDGGHTAISGLSVSYATSSGTCNGNAATATALQTSRSLWGNSFNGSSDIDQMIWINAGGYISGRATLVLNSSSPADFIFKNGETSIGNYGAWTISSRNGESYAQYGLTFFRGNQNAGNSNEACIMKIASNGYVIIGQSVYRTNASYQLHVVGDIYATGGVTSLSDIRKKDVISYELPLSVEQIANAPTIKFTWKDKREEGEQVGTIAQYWEKVLPESIKDKSGELSMSYGVAALVSAITTARKVVDHDRLLREQAAKISELENKCSFLEREVERLKCA